MNGNTEWRGDFGFSYATGAMTIEEQADHDDELDSEYNEYIDGLHTREAQEEEETRKFDAWIEQTGCELFGAA